MSVHEDKTRDTYVFAGGGTAGHVNPALAVAKALEKLAPESKILFLVSKDGLEKDLVEQAGFKYEVIQANPLPENKWAYPAFLFKNFLGFARSYSILKQDKVKAVLGTGGYVSAPLILAARYASIPAYLHEQNAYPGKSNRFLAPRAKAVCLSFAASRKFFEKANKVKFYHSGNPIKEEFFSNDKATVRKILAVGKNETLVVVVGGSLGAKSINKAVEGLPELPAWEKFIEQNPNFRLVLSTGKVNKRFIKEEEPRDKHLQFSEYIDTSAWIPAADLLIGRASGGFLAESAASGQASLLIPFPEAAEDHQMRNAEIFEQAGASLILEDKDLSSEVLLDYLQALLADPTRLNYMRQAARKLAQASAAEKIAKLMLGINLEAELHVEDAE